MFVGGWVVRGWPGPHTLCSPCIPELHLNLNQTPKNNSVSGQGTFGCKGAIFRERRSVHTVHSLVSRQLREP